MKDNKTKEKFIELRAKGLSYDSISKELYVGKATLVTWSKEFQFEIANLKSIELETLLDQHLLSKEKKLEMFKELLEKVKKNFLERDLSDLDTKELFDLILKLAGMLESEVVFKEKTVSSGLDFMQPTEGVKTWTG